MSVLAQARPGSAFRIHPRPRPTELGLLGIVAVAMVLGAAGLGATQRFRATTDAGSVPAGLDFSPPDTRALLIYLLALLAVHLAFVLAGRRTDQVLLPTIGMLGGIGLLLMQRLPQDTVEQSFGSLQLGLGQLQLGWLLIA